MTQSLNTNEKYFCCPPKERASITGSYYQKASVTVEAAMAVPIFLFAVLCLIYLLEVHAIGLTVRSAAMNASKTAAREAVVWPILSPAKLNADIVNLIGAKRLNRSIIEGGVSGIDCSGSYMSPFNDELEVKLKYRMKLPIPTFGRLSVKHTEEFRVKAWTGYVKPTAETDDDQIVYITDAASVYHKSYQCTYLQLSIRFIPASSLPDSRNIDGGKYHKCDKCVFGQMMAGVYITESGNKFHNSVSCSGLKRTIYAVRKSQVKGLGGCHRCS